jgi:hypothetical protein
VSFANNGAGVGASGGSTVITSGTISTSQTSISSAGGSVSVASTIGASAAGMTDGDYNLSIYASCNFAANGKHSQDNANPMLGRLANDGGATQTYALQWRSPPSAWSLPVSMGEPEVLHAEAFNLESNLKTTKRST